MTGLTPKISFMVEIPKKDLDSLPQSVRKFEPIIINPRIHTTKGPTIFGEMWMYSYDLPSLNEEDRTDTAKAFYETFKDTDVKMSGDAPTSLAVGIILSA